LVLTLSLRCSFPLHQSLLTEAHTGANRAAKRDTDVDILESISYYLKSVEKIDAPVIKRSPETDVDILESISYYLKSSENVDAPVIKKRSPDTDVDILESISYYLKSSEKVDAEAVAA
jgi:hypothetical protein